MTITTKIPRNDDLGEKWKNCVKCSSDSLYRPKSMMVKDEDDGKWYCKWHYRWRFNKKKADEYVIEIDESDRGIE